MYLEMLLAAGPDNKFAPFPSAILIAFALWLLCMAALLFVLRRDQERTRKMEQQPRLRMRHYKGTIALVREDDYIVAYEKYESDVLTGRTPPWEKIVVVVRPTFVFYEDEPNKTFMHTGKKHTCYDLFKKLGCFWPEDAPNLYVPWLNEAIVSFEEQAAMFPHYSLEEARNYLLTRKFPETA